MKSPFFIFDTRNQSGAHAVFCGDAFPGIALFDQRADYNLVVIIKLLVLRCNPNALQFFKRRIFTDPVPIGARQPVIYRRNGANRHIHELGQKRRADARNATLKNVINQIVCHSLVVRASFALRLAGAKLFKGWIPIRSKKMAPRPSGVNVHCVAFGQMEPFGNFSASVASQSEPPYFGNRKGVRFGIGGNPALSQVPVIGVIFGGSPSKVLGVAARRIVAFVKGHSPLKRGRTFNQGKSMSIGANIFPLVPKNAITSMVGMPVPMPAFVRPFTVDFVPKSFAHAVVYNSTAIDCKEVNAR